VQRELPGQHRFQELSCHCPVNGTVALVFALAMLLAGSAYAWSNRPEISFSVTRDGEFIRTEARVDLPVSPSLAWAVLTDYERYPRFISTMDESRVVSRSPAGLVVEQKGRFSFLFFSQAIETRLLVSEFPPNVVVARAIEGNFRVMNGRYELLQTGNGVRVSYSGRLVPEFDLPPIVGIDVVHYILLRNFREMVDEMLRRDAVAQREFGLADRSR
jgi:ribosome-associated toxin RatA of RatAB toxin-antitoxin module